MILGDFGGDGEIFFEIDLITADDLELPVTAMLDTGFTELLAVNSQDLEALGWRFFARKTIKNSAGNQDF